MSRTSSVTRARLMTGDESVVANKAASHEPLPLSWPQLSKPKPSRAAAAAAATSAGLSCSSTAARRLAVRRVDAPLRDGVRVLLVARGTKRSRTPGRNEVRKE